MCMLYGMMRMLYTQSNSCKHVFFHFWLQDMLCCAWSMYAGMTKHQHTQAALQQENNWLALGYVKTCDRARYTWDIATCTTSNIYIHRYAWNVEEWQVCVNCTFTHTCHMRRHRDRVKIEKTVCAFWICPNSVHTWYIPVYTMYIVVCRMFSHS